MHDLLFENQGALGDAHLLGYGEQLGLDRVSITAALEGKYAKIIREEFLSGVRSGVNGTPSLFINDLRYDGPHDAQSLYNALTEAAAE
jgi:protein-disulfide isomerase